MCCRIFNSIPVASLAILGHDNQKLSQDVAECPWQGGVGGNKICLGSQPVVYIMLPEDASTVHGLKELSRLWSHTIFVGAGFVQSFTHTFIYPIVCLLSARHAAPQYGEDMKSSWALFTLQVMWWGRGTHRQTEPQRGKCDASGTSEDSVTPTLRWCLGERRIIWYSRSTG